MTASLSERPGPATDIGEPPPVVWWHRVLGALLFAVASAVMAVAAVAAVAAPVDLLRPGGHTMLAPGATAALGLAGLLTLLGLWAVLARTLHGLGVRRAAATASLALVVPVGHAAAQGALYGPVGVLWGSMGLAALSGALVCLVATGLRGRRAVTAAVAVLALAVLAGGVGLGGTVTRIAPRAEFDRHAAIPVLRHPDWDLAEVEASPDQGEVLVEYRHVKRADAEPLTLYAYRPEAADWWSWDEIEVGEGDEALRDDGFVLLRDPRNGPTLYLDLALSTRVQVVWRGATQEELAALAGYIWAATDIERAELRREVGPPRRE